MTPDAALPILVRLTTSGPATAKELGINPVYMTRLYQAGLIKPRAKVFTGERGRPAHIWAATDKGRKRAKRALAR